MAYNRFNPTTILSSYSAIAPLNSNFEEIAAIIDELLSRSDSTSNEMQTPLDMSGFAIQNLSAAVNNSDAVNLGQLNTFLSSLNDLLGGVVPSNAAFPALTRTILANSSTTNNAAILQEAGREGFFLFKTGNFSTVVAADTQQGLYVAPASAPTGASGAWVRQFTGAVNPRWFGISDTNTAAANSTAFAALKATLKARATLSGAYGSLQTVSFPDDKTYNFSSTIEIDIGAVRLTSDVPSTPTTGSTLKFPAGVTAFRFQRYNTSGTTANTGTGTGSDSSIIERLRIIGGYTTTEAEVHGLEIRAHGIKVRDCYIAGFEGDGINIHADVAPGDNGNANCFYLTGNIITGCRDGIAVSGLNGNAGEGDKNDVSQNRRFGINDQSTLGNKWHCIAEGCGITSGTYTPSAVSYSGNRYAVIDGQAAGASTNAPSGTTAHNTWWYYIGPGAADTSTINIPAWVSGTTYRAGGPARTTNNNGGSTFIGCYFEVGQGPAQFVWPTLVIGGDLLSGVSGVSVIRHDDIGVRIDGTFSVGPAGAGGDFSYGPASKALVAVGGSKIQYQDAGATSNWYTYNSGGTFLLYTDQNVGANFYSASSVVFSYDTTGLNLAAGKVLKVNGTQVVGARQTGTAANATDLASAIALVNDLKAKLVSHGLIS